MFIYVNLTLGILLCTSLSLTLNNWFIVASLHQQKENHNKENIVPSAQPKGSLIAININILGKSKSIYEVNLCYVLTNFSVVLTIQHSRLLWEMSECKQRQITAEVEEMSERSIKNFPASKTTLKPIN